MSLYPSRERMTLWRECLQRGHAMGVEVQSRVTIGVEPDWSRVAVWLDDIDGRGEDYRPPAPPGVLARFSRVGLQCLEEALHRVQLGARVGKATMGELQYHMARTVAARKGNGITFRQSYTGHHTFAYFLPRLLDDSVDGPSNGAVRRVIVGLERRGKSARPGSASVAVTVLGSHAPV